MILDTLEGLKCMTWWVLHAFFKICFYLFFYYLCVNAYMCVHRDLQVVVSHLV